MNMIADRKIIEGLKPVAQTVLGALDFNQGKRYADFNASTDQVAAYGLAAIIAGAAAKKLGFFALVTAFVAKFAKVILVLAAGGAAGLVKLFKRKKNPPQAPTAISSDPQQPE